MLPPVPTLRIHDSISLGPLLASDRSEIVAGLNDRGIFEQTLRIPYPYTAADADAFLARVNDGHKSGREFHFSIRDAAGKAIGGCGFHDIHEGHRAEVGYWLTRSYWGRGIMTAVVETICRYGFDELNFVRIVAHVFELNRASARVLEKCGFQREGLLRKHFTKEGQFVDVFLYARLK